MRGDHATVLEPGMCFHLPVAMRRYGEGTVGISQTVVVTETGGQPLHASPEEFFAR